MKTIPFALLPPPLLSKLSPLFKGLARTLKYFKPDLSTELIKSGLQDFEEDEYLSYVLVSSLFNVIIFSGMSYFLLFEITEVASWPLFFIISGFLSFFTFFMQLSYPLVLISKKSKQIQIDLLPFLRDLLIRVKSGINLYDAIKSLSEEDLGIITEELKKVIKEVEAGKSLTKAIEDMGFRTANPYFKKISWQISNSLKAGASIEKSLESLVNNIAKEQVISIKNYGSQLNPLAMMYMMIAVVVPSLGLTFMIVVSSFFGFNLSHNVFYGVTFFLVVFQFFFLGIVKQKRPVIQQ